MSAPLHQGLISISPTGMARTAALPVLVLLLSVPAVAADRIAVRLGMAMADVEPYLRRECEQLIVGGEDVKYVTCQLRSGGLITANISPGDRVTYSVYREPGDLGGVAKLATEVARELGYQGEGQHCMVYSNPSLCWEQDAAKFWVYKAPDGEGRISTFQLADENG